MLFCFLFLACQEEKDPLPKTATTPGADDTVAWMMSEGFKDMYGSWKLLGYLEGEQARDVTLFSLDEQPFHLYEQLSYGKPLLLFTGSYTCDITRSKLPAIQNLYQQYSQQIAMYMIYTLEAHPIDQVSPYSKDHEIWIMPANVRDGVEAKQPRTYGQRIELASHWQKRYAIQVPILMDTPNNLFWYHFGQAPNMAYLIQPNGEVYCQQIWFEEKQMEEQILKLLQKQV